MKSLVIFYSYSGHTKVAAEEIAARESADIAEIKDAERPGRMKAFTAGAPAATKGQSWPIQPLNVELSEYERLILMSPVWAGNTPPAVNAVLEILPEGKTVAIKMISASGGSKCKERLEKIINNKKCVLESFEDIKR